MYRAKRFGWKHQNFEKRIKQIILRKIKEILGIGLLFLLSITTALGQGPSLSPYDLKESYLEKKAAFKRDDTKGLSTDEKAQLDRIVSILEKNASNSFEYHFVKYVNGRYDLSLSKHLMEAQRLQPDNRDLIAELFSYYLLTNNEGQAKIYAQQILGAVSSNTQVYYKALAADPTVSALIVCGEEDGLPLLALQSTGQINKNLKIINLDFLLNDKYRAKINSAYSLGNIEFLNNEKAYLMKLLPKGGSGMAISTTVNQSYFTLFSNKVFLTGLSCRYGSENQMIHLQNFWTRAQKELKSLTLNNRAERKLYRNYLPPLMTYYQLAPKGSDLRTAIKRVLLKLTDQTGKKDEVIAILIAYDKIE